MITLAQLEQEVGRRVGPYWRFFTDRQLPNTAQFTFANLPELRSSIDADLVTNLWLLRRGECFGEPDEVVDMDPVDRQRSVDVYDAEQGRVFPDRPWGTIPEPGEWMEFHHLDPAQELRPAVLAGLARCFFEDLVQAEPNAQYGGIDLTAQFAWLTEKWQVTNVQYGWWAPYQDAPFECVMQRGHVWLMGTTGWWAPVSCWVSAWRPVTSWVNGVDSTGGPLADADELEVDLAYAAAAGHIEAWHLFPARMQQAAAGGVQATQPMAAQEFSRQALVHGPKRALDIGFGTVVSASSHWRGHGWVNW
jgi:hypothetical protein